ncbi:MAG: hypothetical protein ACRDSE_20560 [Pseudonocardiaceae bacterium]
MADSWLGDIGEAVGEATAAARKVYGGESFAGGAASAVGGGGGFRFPDVETADEIIRTFDDRRESINKRTDLIQKAQAALAPPGKDPRSIGYVKAAIDSLDKLRELNESAVKYAHNYIAKIEKAKQAMHHRESDAEDTFRRAQEDQR